MVVVVAAIVMMLAAAIATPAQTYIVAHTFKGSPDGAAPVGGLIRDTAGNLYGTTQDGGSANCRGGCGTVFKLGIGGESALYSFTGYPTDGEYPEARLVRDTAGDLYGTTREGGNYGYGTVFKVDSTGKETVLYSFLGTPPDGAAPVGGLVRDAAGNLYGTTYSGGDFVCQCGMVFKIDPSGKETVLYSFTGGTDGANPVAGLVHDSAGNFYGTTYFGGGVASCGRLGCGTAFKVDRTGKETVLYRFTGGTDGGAPGASLLLDAAGNLYGTASFGGSTPPCGTIFKLDNSGALIVLYGFTCGTDGGIPSSDLVMDAAGNLYGTASEYGDLSCKQAGSLCGTVFELSPTGNLTVLHTFTGGPDGGLSSAGLVRDPAGNLYGTAFLGGAFNYGVVFGIKP
jgi:uncharacterized repeat protein (TIGR03803 family)